MIVSIGSSRAALAAVAAVAALGLAACGDDGAGAGGSGGGATQNPSPPGGGGTATESIAVTVSGAIPTSGNAIVSGSSARAAVLVGTTRRLTADGSGGGLVHRFVVDYDGVTGVVGAVTHGWGASAASLDAATQCVRTVTTAGQVACGAGVAVDVATGRLTFTNLVLRGGGTFTSILNGQVAFVAP
jgi:hypothetical protein